MAISTKTKQVPFNIGRCISAIIGTLILAAIGIGLTLYGFAEQQGWASAIGIMINIAVYLTPTFISLDIYGLDKDGEIPEGTKHPQFVWILILNVFLGALLGVGWIVAFFWAHSPGVVIFPVKDKEDENIDKKSKNTSNQQIDSNLELKLKEINDLLEKGTITKEEYNSKRKHIIESH